MLKAAPPAPGAVRLGAVQDVRRRAAIHAATKAARRFTPGGSKYEPDLFFPHTEIREEDEIRRGIVSQSKMPLKPDDFPVSTDGKKIKKQDGTPIANTDDPAVADDVAERLNEDEARREEDKWSA